MKIDELKEPVWECQEAETPKQYKAFLKILSYGKVDLKRLLDEENKEYEENLQLFERECQEYELALQEYNKKQQQSTSTNKKSTKKDKPVKPKKPQKPYTEKTLRSISSNNKWEHRLKAFLTQDHDELLLDLYLDLKKDLKNIYGKQVELYKKATDKLYNDLSYGEIPWSQFNQGVQGLKTLYEMLLQQQEKPTSHEKKEVNMDANIRSKNENYLFTDELSDYNLHDTLMGVASYADDGESSDNS